MLNKIVLRKTTSAIFLAIVLIAGTITLIYPSFSVEAQATSDREKDYDDDRNDSYEKDRDYKSRDHDERDYDDDHRDKKSYYKDDYKSEYSSYGKYESDHDKSKKDSNSVSIKKVKCNNINVNLNGIDVDIGLPNANGPFTDAVALAQEVEDDDEIESNSINSDEEQDDDEIESNSINSDEENYKSRDGKSDSDSNSRIVCINNNNNIVVEEEEEPEPPEPVDECILCFEETNQTVRDAVIEALEAPGPLVIVPGVYEVPATVLTIEELCEWLTDPENGPLFLTQEQIEDLIDSFIDANPGLSRADVEELVQCLIDAEIIVVVPPEPPGGCADCFTTIPNDGPWPPGLLNQFIDFLEEEQPTVGGDTVTNIQQLCTALLNADPEVTTSEFRELLEEALPGNANKNTINAVIACLIATGDLVVG